MKAKHAIARIKGSSVWTKIFCVLLAITLLLLMVPNGLRANATVIYGDEQTDTQAEEVNKTDLDGAQLGTDRNAVEKEYMSFSDLLALGSAVTFDPKSFNMDETTGYFHVETAKVTVQQALFFLLNRSRISLDDQFSFDKIKLNENGQISKEDMAKYFAVIGAAIPYIPFDQLDYYEEDVHGSYTAHMEKAIEVPDYLLDIAQTISKLIEGQVGYYIYDGAEIIKDVLNTIIPSNTDITMPKESFNYPPFPNWPFTNDGSIFMLNLYPGQGDNLLDILQTTNITATRVIPMNQGELADPLFSNDADTLLKSNNAQANAEANIQPYFMNWDIDLFGDGMSLPIQSWQSFYGPLKLYINNSGVWTMKEVINYKPLPIKSDVNVRLTANFWDVEGLVPVHLNFNDGYVGDTMRKALRADGWMSTDFISGSTWTKNYWEWTPTWYVYSDIFEKFGPWIFGPDPLNKRSEVFKDQMIYNEYWKVPGEVAFPSWTNVPFPGPHWFESDNDNWFGTLDKETTLSFSVYPVSPRGHVVHQGYGDNPIEMAFDVADPVNKAYVMFYNEYDMPLFSYFNHHWDSTPFDAWPESGYYYGRGVDVDDPSFVPDWCFDTQIDHAIVYAWDDDYDNPWRWPATYVPLYVSWEQFSPEFATLFDFGMCDFSVERLMYADVEKFMDNAGIESFEVTYFEDGQPLFEPQIVDARYTGMLGIPMVTNGTITTGDTRLVTGFNCFLDFARPFGETDAYNTFQDIDNNFTVSPTLHWYQCQIKANMKPGFNFTNWFYDYRPITADTYAGQSEIIIKEQFMIFNHKLMAGFAPVAATVNPDEVINPTNADGTAIYGSEAVAPVAATPDGNVVPVSDGTAQTGDSAGIALAVLALVALAGAGVLASRKLYMK